MSEQPESFFAEVPSGTDIANWFLMETDRRNDGPDGVGDLFREGPDYCYLWVEAMVDDDMWAAYLLDVRTKVEGSETRDFLYVRSGVGYRAPEVEWHQRPVRFDDDVEVHRDRAYEGLRWFVMRVDGSREHEQEKRA